MTTDITDTVTDGYIDHVLESDPNGTCFTTLEKRLAAALKEARSKTASAEVRDAAEHVHELWMEDDPDDDMSDAMERLRDALDGWPAQLPPFLLTEYIRRQAEWSERTFGPGERREGIADHIRKELDEVIDAGFGDISEWVDVIILGLDGAWREGATPEDIVTALRAKAEKNRARVWPDWRTAEPGKAIEHDRTGEVTGTVHVTYKDPDRSIELVFDNEGAITEEQCERLCEVGPGEYLTVEVDLKTGAKRIKGDA